MNHLPTKEEAENRAREKHDQFLRWMEEGERFVNDHRLNHYESVLSLADIPPFEIGISDVVSKAQFDIPLPWRSDKAGFCVFVLRVLIGYIEGIYDGGYLLCRDPGISASNVSVFRVLPNGEFGVFQVVLSLDGNLAAAEMRYAGYSRFDINNTEWINKQYRMSLNYDKMIPRGSYWKDNKQHSRHKVGFEEGGVGTVIAALMVILSGIGIPPLIYYIIKFHRNDRHNRRECLLGRATTRPTPGLRRLAEYGELTAEPAGVEHRLYSQRLMAAFNEVVGRVMGAT